MANGRHSGRYVHEVRAVRFGLSGPDDIRAQSSGEVTRPETFATSTGRPVTGGLYCERIFGSASDPGGRSRYRSGHIELAAPVVHIWFFKAMPSRLGTLLDMKTSSLERIIYFQDYVVTQVGGEGCKLKVNQLLTEDDFKQAREEYGDTFEVDMGAEAVRKLLLRLDLANLSRELRDRLDKEMAKGDEDGMQMSKGDEVEVSDEPLKDLVKRLKTVESLRDNGDKCEWMVLDCISVVPPATRAARRRTARDLDELYSRVINRNNRLKKLVQLNAPEVIIRNEKRMLQQSVDALFDNNRCKRPVLNADDRPLESLTDRVKGKLGRFRENLLGKRVDYSARATAVPGPELRLHQCGLPKKIALELYRPFVLGWLIARGSPSVRDRARALADALRPGFDPAMNWATASRRVEELGLIVWDALEEVMRDRPVLLCRRPVVDRSRQRAFVPVLADGDAVRVHPLAGAAMGLGFGGGRVVVHLPLSDEARVEALVLMTPEAGIDPASPLAVLPTADVVLGCHYLTVGRGEAGERVEPGEGIVFHSPMEVFQAHAAGKLGLHARVQVRLPLDKKVVSEVRDERGTPKVTELPRKLGGLVHTTAGRVIFNDLLKPELPFYDFALTAANLARILADCRRLLGPREAAALLDRVKTLGFREATRAGLSLAVGDLLVPEIKEAELKEADNTVEKARRIYERGFISHHERYGKVLDAWSAAQRRINEQLQADLSNDRRSDPDSGKVVPYLNPLHLMFQSGARGTVEQLRHLAGMPGLIRFQGPFGSYLVSVRSSLREGLNAMEYWPSASVARTVQWKAAVSVPADTAYLTRRLIDLAGDVMVTMHDCGTACGITKTVFYSWGRVARPLADAIRGRVACRTLTSPYDGSVVVLENSLVGDDTARRIEGLGIDTFRVRSPLRCQAPTGVCRMCYGADPATGRLVEEGTAVGVLAAQTLGPPAAGLNPRIFGFGPYRPVAWPEREAKTRKGGVVRFVNLRVATNDLGERIALTLGSGAVEILRYKDCEVIESHPVPHGARMLVEQGLEVSRGQTLFDWDPHDDPVVAGAGGRIEFREVVEGQTFRAEVDRSTGGRRLKVVSHRGDLHPHVVVRDERGQAVACHHLPVDCVLEVHDGQVVAAGTRLARTPQNRGEPDWVDGAGGFPRLLELLEARRPRRTSVLAEVAGVVRIGEPVHLSLIIRVQPTDDTGRPAGEPVEHQVPSSHHRRVYDGDWVEKGTRLSVDGSLAGATPASHDVLRLLGLEELQHRLVTEILGIYRRHRVDLDDRHVEVVVARMLRHVRIDGAGDTGLLAGTLADGAEVRRANERIAGMAKVVDPADSPFTAGSLVACAVFQTEQDRLEHQGRRIPTAEAPQPAVATPQLLGMTRASTLIDSPLAAAGFLETTKALTEATLAGRVDPLAGLRENVLLGRLIPAGTGWPGNREAVVREAERSQRVSRSRKRVDGLFLHDRLRPPVVRAELTRMVALGYAREHLVITADGTVLFDPEAADLDAHRRVFGHGPADG